MVGQRDRKTEIQRDECQSERERERKRERERGGVQRDKEGKTKRGTVSERHREIFRDMDREIWRHTER